MIFAGICAGKRIFPGKTEFFATFGNFAPPRSITTLSASTDAADCSHYAPALGLRQLGHIKEFARESRHDGLSNVLPPAIIDQLLTGYLDEVLSADELAQVEKLLQNAPAVAEELAKLHELRLALKSIALADDDIRLDAGFAERVVDEAVLRAWAEGLADEHPLLQLEEQGKSNVKPVATVPTWRVAAVMVGLAASIALAVVLVRSDSHRGSGNSPADVVVQVDPGVPVPEEQRGSGFGTDAGTAIVSNRKDEPLVEPVAPGPDLDKPLEALANNQNANNQNANNQNANKQNTDAGSSVATKDTGPKPDQEAADMVSVEPNQPAALGIIAVYHVELTDLGREQEAFKNALTLAGLSLDPRRKFPRLLSDSRKTHRSRPRMQR